MTEEYHASQIPLQYPEEQKNLAAFLAAHELTYEADIEAAFGILDTSDSLVACGCAAGPLLKCFAVNPELRGQNALGILVPSLTQERFSAGYYDLFVVTRRKNELQFINCGLYPVVHTDQLVLLENRIDGPKAFTDPLYRRGDDQCTVGAVVMNCDPFTLGHQSLAEYAASQCDVLHIFVLSASSSFAPPDVRYRLAVEGTKHLAHVRVHMGGMYIISSATFPTYFLKKNEDAAALQMELDLTLFSNCIAPALHITKRFAGQEPLDPVTAKYNDTMKRILPQHGIDFIEIPRISLDGHVISASQVRRLFQKRGACKEVLDLVPEPTKRYLENRAALELTPVASGKGSA